MMIDILNILTNDAFANAPSITYILNLSLQSLQLLNDIDFCEVFTVLIKHQK